MWVKFLYEDHQVKVSAAKKCKNPYSYNVKLKSAVEDRAVKFAGRMGFRIWRSK